MFGKRKRLESKVEQGEARRAHATVLKVTRILPGQMAPRAKLDGTFHVTARVEPEGEAWFEAHFNVHVTHLTTVVREGERIPVIYSGDKVAWDEPVAPEETGRKAAAKLDLSDEEKDRFRNTLLRKLDELHDKGKMSDSEYFARKAEIEADPDLNPSA